jgi:hypothetical protein
MERSLLCVEENVVLFYSAAVAICGETKAVDHVLLVAEDLMMRERAT